MGQRLSETVVFWNDHDAFLFLTLNSTGRSRNILLEKVASARYGYLTLLAGGFADFNKQDLVAYHLASTGQLNRFALPENSAPYGTWTLSDGRLQMTPPVSTGKDWAGTRWDGEKFEPAQAAAKPQLEPQPRSATDSNLRADDLSDDENRTEEYEGFLSKTSRQGFKDAGWGYKVLTGYESTGSAATLPISMGDNTSNLTIQTFPVTKDRGEVFDFLWFGTRNIQISDRKPQAASSLLRRRRAMGVCMPEANPSELLQAFLKMRDQVCRDLGIQAVNDDTLPAYIGKVQRSVTEMREAVQAKNFVKGLPEVYLRKQGFNRFAAGAR